MRALVAAPGAPGGIELREVEEPSPAAGVAVVEVRSQLAEPRRMQRRCSPPRTDGVPGGTSRA